MVIGSVLVYNNYMKQYILGTLGLLLGIVMVVKTDILLRNFGRIDWFEEHLAMSGGSRAGYKIIGIIFILMALLALTGQFGSVAGGVLKKIFVH